MGFGAEVFGWISGLERRAEACLVRVVGAFMAKMQSSRSERASTTYKSRGRSMG